MTQPSFNLIDEPFLAVTRTDGTQATVSLAEAFGATSEIRAIAGDSPTQNYALLRLLLATYWSAHRADAELGDPSDPDRFTKWWGAEADRVDARKADQASLEYLKQHRRRFDLFGKSPFMQVADLRTSKDSRFGVRRILPEAESDYFALRAASGLDKLSFAEAARWLVTVQSYDASGIKSGAVGDPRVKGGRGYPIGTGWTGMTGGTVIHGATLAETLLLNTAAPSVFGSTNQLDMPVWEREPDTAAPRQHAQPTGPRDLLTWQSRRVRLFAEGDAVVAVLVSNGDQIPDAGANIRLDPMTPYRYSTNKSKKGVPVYYPRPHDTDRTVWKSLEPLLMRESLIGTLEKPEHAPVQPATIDFLGALKEIDFIERARAFDLELTSVAYGAQSATVADTVHARLGLPLVAFQDDNAAVARTMILASKSTQNAAVALGRYAGQLLQAAGGEYKFQSSPTDELLNELEPQFVTWLAEVQPQTTDNALELWASHVRRSVNDLATSLLKTAGPKALIGRQVDDKNIVSAGSAYRSLHRQLDKILPTTARKQEPANDK